ncbi:hypothetical protein TNCV_4115591 [Trichonephila clavipes]|nr:hypothetical protein TNCV_4115591 [Trichonephila clavipes]
MGLVSLKLGQETRLTPELAPPSQLPHHMNGRTLKKNDTYMEEREIFEDDFDQLEGGWMSDDDLDDETSDGE